ncbi:nuclear transport factor 2 family protein [Aquimarina pacifica]|uniref:nuclear transport factor 2 family protein n=1 Tax=Aquimarina pacifica TaxID=1296415 RepID=UPI000471F716|nr:nuclear transport factor 2 family protein [Aquimarina pacifica]
MYKLLLFVMLLFCSSVFSQKETSKNEIDRYKREVKETILDFFEGFHSGDTSKLNKVMSPQLVLQTIIRDKDSLVKVRSTSADKLIKAIANKPSDQKWEEKLLSFTISANKDIANAWTPYEFYLNNSFSHCGVNIFQLYNDGKGWKIIALADTRHKQNCD